ncbi:MAG: HAMP domain-containing sensor histidine kinase [Acidimicrobiales bacterium]
MRRSSRSAIRLAVMQGSILAVVLGVVAMTLVATFATSYQSVAARSLISEIRAFASGATARPTNQSLEQFSVKYLSTHTLAAGGSVLVVLANKRVQTAGSEALERSRTVTSLLRSPPRRSLVVATTIGTTPVELVAAPLMVGHHIVGTIIATADLTSFAAEKSRVLDLSLAEAALALVAGTAGGYLLLRQLLRTVGRITMTADSLGRSSLDDRLGDQGRDDEVGALARTFDEMLDRIQAMVEGQRRLLADVSHQLRTPLTVARGHLEVLARTGTEDPSSVRETIDLVVDELGHMAALVERLLMLGHAMDPGFLELHPVDLRTLIADCDAAAKVLAPREFSLGDVPDVVVMIDEEKIRGAILNLVANAVNATRTGDAVRLSARIDPLTGEISLIVEDGGPGIAPAQRERLLGRFARLSESTSDGSGLGLAIVKAVSEAHGGRVDVGDSHLGGAKVTIVLPGSDWLE